MASTLKVDNIIATDGTTAPITLSGDAATLGSAVTFPTASSGLTAGRGANAIANATTSAYLAFESEL